jgi:uracil-DNA glycosylase
MTTYKRLIAEVRACQICAGDLPLGPRPIVRGNACAKILIIGQAPGTRVHETGEPWDDKSGERLRNWMNLSSDAFYDENKIAIMPMGFCYPGRASSGGDLPPRPECAPQWHSRIRTQLNQIKLTLLVGSYAQKHYLGKKMAKTMTETIRLWKDFSPDIIPTPHPSWRTTFWLKKNLWFEDEVLPDLRARVKRLVLK